MAFRIKILVNYILGVTVRPVINPLSFLIFYYLFLLGKNRLGNGIDKISKFIGFGPDHFFQGVVWYRLEIIGPVAAGRTIGSATTYTGTQFVKTSLAQVFRFKEKQVFKKMGKACSSFGFPVRTHMTCKRYSYHWI